MTFDEKMVKWYYSNADKGEMNMGIYIDFLPEAEVIRMSLVNCPECNCRKKYLQLYRYGTKMKIRCPKCNNYVVEETDQELIDNWNRTEAMVEY